MKNLFHKIIYTTIFFLLAVFPLTSETFVFKYLPDDLYRILSTVQEDVYVNGRLSHNAEIVNRISVEVTNVANGIGEHSARYMTTENANRADTNQVFTWGGEYFSKFTRDSQGFYKISDEYFMPVVRNVPIFPKDDIKVGAKWKAVGEEAHDLRRTFSIEKPFKVPFEANYVYQGTIDKDGKKLHVINAKYTLNFTSPIENISNEKNQSFEERDCPYNTLGYSDQLIYWDNERGMIDSYSENFRIVIETLFGNVLEFRGTAKAEVTDRKKLDDEVLKDVEQKIKDLDVENTNVKSDADGITISIENIQFEANSAILKDSEKAKLTKISSVLKQFPDNDLLISGHTALAGTPGAREKLSKERSDAVAKYLIEIGVKDAYHIFTRGFGAEKPIDTNDTPEGMARNRRVEITIMK